MDAQTRPLTRAVRPPARPNAGRMSGQPSFANAMTPPPSRPTGNLGILPATMSALSSATSASRTNARTPMSQTGCSTARNHGSRGRPRRSAAPPVRPPSRVSAPTDGQRQRRPAPSGTVACQKRRRRKRRSALSAGLGTTGGRVGARARAGAGRGAASGGLGATGPGWLGVASGSV